MSISRTATIRLLSLFAASSVVGLYFVYRYFGFDGLSKCYSAVGTIAVILYAKSKKFYFIVKKFKYMFIRNCTFWNVAFRFVITHVDTRTILEQNLANILGEISKANIGNAEIEKKSQSSVTLIIKGGTALGFLIETDGDNISVISDRLITVPAHHAHKTQYRLRKLAETLTKIFNPSQTFCTVDVTFDGPDKNPYYGLFVDRVPKELIQDFNVRFSVAQASGCTVEAHKDKISLQARSVTDLLDGVESVLTLSALPVGGDNEAV